MFNVSKTNLPGRQIGAVRVEKVLNAKSVKEATEMGVLDTIADFFSGGVKKEALTLFYNLVKAHRDYEKAEGQILRSTYFERAKDAYIALRNYASADYKNCFTTDTSQSSFYDLVINKFNSSDPLVKFEAYDTERSGPIEQTAQAPIFPSREQRLHARMRQEASELRGFRSLQSHSPGMLANRKPLFDEQLPPRPIVRDVSTERGYLSADPESNKESEREVADHAENPFALAEQDMLADQIKRDREAAAAIERSAQQKVEGTGTDRSKKVEPVDPNLKPTNFENCIKLIDYLLRNDGDIYEIRGLYATAIAYADKHKTSDSDAAARDQRAMSNELAALVERAPWIAD